MNPDRRGDARECGERRGRIGRDTRTGAGAWIVDARLNAGRIDWQRYTAMRPCLPCLQCRCAVAMRVVWCRVTCSTDGLCP